MNDQQRTNPLSPQTKRAQGGVGEPHLHEGAEPGSRNAAHPGADQSQPGGPDTASRRGQVPHTREDGR